MFVNTHLIQGLFIERRDVFFKAIYTTAMLQSPTTYFHKVILQIPHSNKLHRQKGCSANRTRKNFRYYVNLLRKYFTETFPGFPLPFNSGAVNLIFALSWDEVLIKLIESGPSVDRSVHVVTLERFVKKYLCYKHVASNTCIMLVYILFTRKYYDVKVLFKNTT